MARQSATREFPLSNVGDTLEGFYVRHTTEEKNGNDGVYLSHSYFIRDEISGNDTEVFGSTGINNAFFQNEKSVLQFPLVAKIPLGCYVWMERKEDQKTKSGNTMKIIKVEFDDEKKIDLPKEEVIAPPAPASTNPDDLPF